MREYTSHRVAIHEGRIPRERCIDHGNYHSLGYVPYSYTSYNEVVRGLDYANSIINANIPTAKPKAKPKPNKLLLLCN